MHVDLDLDLDVDLDGRMDDLMRWEFLQSDNKPFPYPVQVQVHVEVHDQDDDFSDIASRPC